MRWLLRSLLRDRITPPASPGALARRIGRRGERAAARRLRRSGYRLLARNVRTPAGEIDLLARERGRLVLVEVKSSTRTGGARLASRLERRQKRRLVGAGRWLCRRAGVPDVRFRVDLVTVTFDGRRALVTILRNVCGG